MKSLLVISALLLPASPAIAKHDFDLDKLKGYNYGYIYGIGNALCGITIDKFIEKEYAQKLLSGTVKALSKNPENKPFVSDIQQAYRDITEDVTCKEVYQ